MNINTKSAADRTYDAIVSGSGLSGGWAAKELTEKGLTVLMIERGHQLEHIKGYKTAMEPPWEFKHRGEITTEQRKTHEFLSRDYPYSQFTASYWSKDSESAHQEKQKFDSLRQDSVGGTSIMWGRQR